jgi:hypothetical protein
MRSILPKNMTPFIAFPPGTCTTNTQVLLTVTNPNTSQSNLIGGGQQVILLSRKIDLILVGVGMDVGLDTINGGDFCSSFRFFLPV